MTKQRHEGRVRIFKADRGFGFIEADGDLIFFHVSDVVGPAPLIVPRETRVTFEIGMGRTGRAAAKCIEVIA